MTFRSCLSLLASATLLTAGSLLACSPACAADATANVNITTMKMVIPGMPKFQLPPGVHLPPGVKIPDPTAAHRMFTVHVTGTEELPADAKATLAAPGGLGVKSPVSLGIVRPQAADPGHLPTATVESYWGSGATIPAGQPKEVTVDPSTLPRSRFGRGASAISRSMAMWPSSQDPRGSMLTDTASAVGDYDLQTSYAGNATFHVDPNEDFMPPVELTAPADKVDVDQAITVSWNQVPHALAYSVMAVGAQPAGDNGPQKMVFWTAGSAPLVGPAMEKAGLDAAQAIKDGLFLSPDTSTVTIPAGVLKGLEGAAVIVTAYGPTKVVAGAPTVHITTTSEGVLVVGGFVGGRVGGAQPGPPPGQ